MRVNRSLLKQHMAYRGLGVRELADRCRPRLSRSTVGHLVSGERKTCAPATARAIERALDVPPGTLFEPAVFSAQANIHRAS